MKQRLNNSRIPLRIITGLNFRWMIGLYGVSLVFLKYSLVIKSGEIVGKNACLDVPSICTKASPFDESSSTRGAHPPPSSVAREGSSVHP